MNTILMATPWWKATLTQEIEDAIQIIKDDVWKEASIRFYAERDAKIKSGKTAPKGMQRYLNEVLNKRFLDAGWEGDSGYYYKNHTWIRITFRHQMSIGSDFLDAIKVCKKEGMSLAVILAADRKTLDIISPNDAAALISFEKLQNEAQSLNGAIDIPLVIGGLYPFSSASNDINVELRKERPRDITLPND